MGSDCADAGGGGGGGAGGAVCRELMTPATTVAIVLASIFTVQKSCHCACAIDCCT